MLYLSQITVCCIFQNLINAIRGLNAFKKKGQRFLPRIYINRENILSRAKEGTGEITVNIKRLRKVFSAYGGGVWLWLILAHEHLLEVQLKLLHVS